MDLTKGAPSRIALAARRQRTTEHRKRLMNKHFSSRLAKKEEVSLVETPVKGATSDREAPVASPASVAVTEVSDDDSLGSLVSNPPSPLAKEMPPSGIAMISNDPALVSYADMIIPKRNVSSPQRGGEDTSDLTPKMDNMSVAGSVASRLHTSPGPCKYRKYIVQEFPTGETSDLTSLRVFPDDMSTEAFNQMIDSFKTLKAASKISRLDVYRSWHGIPFRNETEMTQLYSKIMALSSLKTLVIWNFAESDQWVLAHNLAKGDAELEALHLHMPVGSVSSTAFWDIIGSLPTLITLQVEVQDTFPLASALQSPFCHLQNLRIGSKSLLFSDIHATAWSHCLATTSPNFRRSPLVVLDLLGWMPAHQVYQLAKTLQTNRTLRSLKISFGGRPSRDEDEMLRLALLEIAKLLGGKSTRAGKSRRGSECPLLSLTNYSAGSFACPEKECKPEKEISANLEFFDKENLPNDPQAIWNQLVKAAPSYLPSSSSTSGDLRVAAAVMGALAENHRILHLDLWKEDTWFWLQKQLYLQRNRMTQLGDCGSVSDYGVFEHFQSCTSHACGGGTSIQHPPSDKDSVATD